MPKISKKTLQDELLALDAAFDPKATSRELQAMLSNLKKGNVIENDASAVTMPMNDDADLTDFVSVDIATEEPKTPEFQPGENVETLSVETPAETDTPSTDADKLRTKIVKKINNRLEKDAETVKSYGILVAETLLATRQNEGAIILKASQFSDSSEKSYGIQDSGEEYGFFSFTQGKGVRFISSAETLKKLLPSVVEFINKIATNPPAKAGKKNNPAKKKADTENTPSAAYFKKTDAGKLIYLDPSKKDEAAVHFKLGDRVTPLSGIYKDKPGTLRRYTVDKGTFRIKFDDGPATGIAPGNISLL